MPRGKEAPHLDTNYSSRDLCVSGEMLEGKAVKSGSQFSHFNALQEQYVYVLVLQFTISFKTFCILFKWQSYNIYMLKIHWFVHRIFALAHINVVS